MGNEPENDLPLNKGKLQLDATVADADIKYPTDLDMLNDSREKAEELIDHQPHVRPIVRGKAKAKVKFGVRLSSKSMSWIGAIIFVMNFLRHMRDFSVLLFNWICNKFLSFKQLIKTQIPQPTWSFDGFGFIQLSLIIFE